MKRRCSLCGVNLSIDNFYKSEGYKDGFTKRCKSCIKKKSREREMELRSTPEGLEKDRERHREKAKRLNYNERKTTTAKKSEYLSRYYDKFPEKYKAKCKASRVKPSKKGNHLHHWSYNKEHYTDVIELKKEDHYFIHRYIDYDKESKMYKTLEGELLDSKRKHLEFFSKIKKALR